MLLKYNILSIDFNGYICHFFSFPYLEHILLLYALCFDNNNP